MKRLSLIGDVWYKLDTCNGTVIKKTFPSSEAADKYVNHQSGVSPFEVMLLHLRRLSCVDVHGIKATENR